MAISAIDAVWIATAALATKATSRKSSNFQLQDVCFEATTILELAKHITEEVIDISTVLQSATAHAENSQANYLVDENGMRRVSFMGEFAGDKECPTTDAINESRQFNEIQKLADTTRMYEFMNRGYTEQFKKGFSNKRKRTAVTEWFISCNPKKYDIVSAFKELNKIDWKQSTNVAVGDIIYMYVSQGYQAVKYKCKVNKVDLSEPTIDDRKFEITGKFNGTYGRYMELELIKELSGELYSKPSMESHGFSTPQSPVRVTPQVKEYLDLVQMLQEAQDLDPDIHDGSYELVRETINSYANMGDLSKVDYKDLNLVYLMTIGTWKQKVSAKKKTIADSNLPQSEKDRLTSILEKVWSKAKKFEYQNEEKGRASIGMFGTGFFTFLGKTDDDSPRNFIQMCIDIKDMTDEQEVFNRCSKTLTDSFHGMKTASASMILHCLKPMMFPIFNSNMGADNIFVYLGTEMKWKTEINSYIKNVRLVKKLRDENFTVKNYRIFDMAAWEIGKSNNNTNIDYSGAENDMINNMDIEQVGEFMDRRNKVNYDKNMILYGPPRTGKTYNTAIYAVAICDEKRLEDVEAMPYDAVLKRYKELKDNEKRIAFTTFHQSYGYEEFIEGIKPVLESESKDVSYRIEDGIFKRFCKRAGRIDIKGKGLEILEDADVWKVTVRNEVRDDCFQNDRVRINWDIDSEGATGFENEIKKGDIIITTSGSRTCINGVAIVTSEDAYVLEAETDKTTRDVRWLAVDIDENIKSINKGKMLHRMTCARVPDMKAEDIIALAQRSDSTTGKENIEMKQNTKPYVFIIDEINRGNISKIFGELITLIEPTKRKGSPEEMEAILPYSNMPFGVPDNVYIIGTMNTADRSIALMDTALRRRFQFIEKMPDVEVLRKIGADKIYEGGIELDVAYMLECINERIEYLFDREHTIGHAFFTGLKDEPTVAKLASIFKKSVIPLLQEYFYEDYSKIMLVLGDNGKEHDEQKFILATETKANHIFRGDSSDIDIPDYSYQIQDSAFEDIMSYIGITE